LASGLQCGGVARHVLSRHPDIRHFPVTLVAASGRLFAVRGVAVLAGQGWAMREPWRWLGHGIDTLLRSAWSNKLGQRQGLVRKCEAAHIGRRTGGCSGTRFARGW